MFQEKEFESSDEYNRTKTNKKISNVKNIYYISLNIELS